MSCSGTARTFFPSTQAAAMVTDSGAGEKGRCSIHGGSGRRAHRAEFLEVSVAPLAAGAILKAASPSRPSLTRSFASLPATLLRRTLRTPNAPARILFQKAVGIRGRGIGDCLSAVERAAEGAGENHSNGLCRSSDAARCSSVEGRRQNHEPWPRGRRAKLRAPRQRRSK